MLIEDESTKCPGCKNPLTWVGRSKQVHQGRDVYELDFRCGTCQCEYRFRDGKLKELKVERDPVAEQLAIREAEVDAVRDRRCSICGGPLDDWLTCDWCHQRFSVESGELVPRTEEALQPKPQMSDFYADQ
jgi:uncharacterized protein YbaR (Trm112 family)